MPSPPLAAVRLDRHQALRLGGLALIAFVLMTGYALARPSTESLFLEEWGRDALPWAWGGVAIAATLAVAGWQRLARKVELAAVMGVVGACSAGLLALLLLLHRAGWVGASFLLYVWKDVYIVVLVETFYAFANVVFPLKTARWAYGLLGACGSLGGMLGNLAVGRIAATYGTATVPWLLIIDLAVVCGLAGALSRLAGAPRTERPAAPPGLVEGARVVARSRYLLLVLLLILVVQLCVNLVDFAYAGVLETAFPDLDQRTAVIGQVYAVIDGGALLLHVLTGPLLRALGVRATLLGLPLVLSAACAGALLVPGFASMAATKVASKVFDYTLFRAAKEALYLPLSFREKTEGKAVVDMLTYRVAKGGASLLVMGMIAAAAQALALPLVLGLTMGWLGLAVGITRRYAQRLR
ncbi:MAG: hypothetical protein GXP62_16475 [Oligoflexia bacterium]|nr:hypothetical protein [Oligoflexia bacterium]